MRLTIFGQNVMRASLLAGLGALLAGCASELPKVASLKEGACKLAHTPSYEVKGKTAYDQEWIDDTIEGLVGGCRQPRPKARPSSIDNPPGAKIIMQTPTTGIAVAPKKKHWWQR